ncbi:MAG: rRNA maturation RNase YbeY [Candidatus Colwellbacteria bacterium]|nr:rRNA maturation RNase YbeY [Candidatus Colwellbacteria bacterium]
MNARVSVIALDKRFKKLEKELKKKILLPLEFLKLGEVEFEVYLVSRAEMRKINQEFRGKNQPTNILSFPWPREFPRVPRVPEKLGEIYLCPPVIRERKEGFEELLFHGLLHLSGFNHDIKNARMGMNKLESNFSEWLKQRS